MGRGRQRAKQMKVARRLKYFSPDTDLEALQRELAGAPEGDQPEFADPVDEYYVDGDDEDGDDDDYEIPSATGDDSWD